MVGGAVLPVAKHNGKLYFLFGKENSMEDSASGYSDFGGGVEKGETALSTAIREGEEETTGFISSSFIRKQLSKKKFPVQIENYTTFLIRMDYDPNLIKYYNDNHSFLWRKLDKKYLNSTKLFEKIQINWFCETELKRKRKQFRGFYQHMVDQIIAQLPQIHKWFGKGKSQTLRAPRH